MKKCLKRTNWLINGRITKTITYTTPQEFYDKVMNAADNKKAENTAEYCEIVLKEELDFVEYGDSEGDKKIIQFLFSKMKSIKFEDKIISGGFETVKEDGTSTAKTPVGCNDINKLYIVRGKHKGSRWNSNFECAEVENRQCCDDGATCTDGSNPTRVCSDAVSKEDLKIVMCGVEKLEDFYGTIYYTNAIAAGSRIRVQVQLGNTDVGTPVTRTVEAVEDGCAKTFVVEHSFYEHYWNAAGKANQSHDVDFIVSVYGPEDGDNFVERNRAEFSFSGTGAEMGGSDLQLCTEVCKSWVCMDLNGVSSNENFISGENMTIQYETKFVANVISSIEVKEVVYASNSNFMKTGPPGNLSMNINNRTIKFTPTEDASDNGFSRKTRGLTYNLIFNGEGDEIARFTIRRNNINRARQKFICQDLWSNPIGYGAFKDDLDDRYYIQHVKAWRNFGRLVLDDGYAAMLDDVIKLGGNLADPYVTSTGRMPYHNASLVGASKTSRHLFGRAIDFRRTSTITASHFKADWPLVKDIPSKHNSNGGALLEMAGVKTFFLRHSNYSGGGGTQPWRTDGWYWITKSKKTHWGQLENGMEKGYSKATHVHFQIP